MCQHILGLTSSLPSSNMYVLSPKFVSETSKASVRDRVSGLSILSSTLQREGCKNNLNFFLQKLQMATDPPPFFAYAPKKKSLKIRTPNTVVGVFCRIWAPRPTSVSQIWPRGVSLKRSCKMHFRRVDLVSIGPPSQK